MKQDDVKVGGKYMVKVSGKVTRVRIDGENPNGGWDATNLATRKKVRIKTAGRLRGNAEKRDAAKEATKAVKASKAKTPKVETDSPAEEASKAAARGVRRKVAKGSAKAKEKATAKAAKAEAETAKPKARKKRVREDGTMSGLDAAAKVLAEAGEPMDCKSIVERALEAGYWKTNGKTPAATVYAAIIREIAKKGGEARFVKTDRGMFAIKA